MAQKPKKSHTQDGKKPENEIVQENTDDPDQEMDLAVKSADGLLGGVDAINLDQGWRGYLMGIGFEGHVRPQIRAAIGSYFYEHGSRADRGLLRAEIAKAIEESPFLDTGEPGSRTRAYARGYLSAPPGSKSNVDELLADIADRQAESERQAYERCEPTWELPQLSTDEAFAKSKARSGRPC
jgi:hypothetical protein